MKPKDQEEKLPKIDDAIDNSEVNGQKWHSGQNDDKDAADKKESKDDTAEIAKDAENADSKDGSSVKTGSMKSDIPKGSEKPKRTFGQKLKALLKSKKFWISFVVLLLVVAIAAWFIQPSRWWIANLFGGNNTLTIKTITPGEGKSKAADLSKVAVTVNGKSYTTDDDGTVKVSGVPYGKSMISAKKTGYQDANYTATLDFDPFFHVFGGKAQDDAARNVELSMTATGIPVSFKVVDWLSGQPITTGEFKVSDVVAEPDSQGLVSLKIPGTDDSKVMVSASFGGKYIDKDFEVALGSATPETVSFVPGGKQYFISNRSGVLTVYSSNLDGSDVQPIVVGTGQEDGAIAFAVSPDGKYGVLSSSRDGERNAKKELLQRLYVVDLSTKQITRVDEANNIRFADWSGNTLVYTTSGYDATGNNYISTLRSVDTDSKRVNNFESSDGSISVQTVAYDEVVYGKYVYSGDDKSQSPILRVANVNGTSMTTLGNRYENYVQLDFDRVAFKTEQDQAWHEYNLNTDSLKSIAQPLNSSTEQQYLSTANSSGSKRLMIDRIDGKYTLKVKDTGTGEVKVLSSAAGLGGPIRWINDVIVYRVVTQQETADYAVSLNGGEPKKITDVTATGSTQGSRVDQRFWWLY